MKKKIIPALFARPKQFAGIDVSKIARPGSLDILSSPSRIGRALFYPDGKVIKDKETS